MSSVRRWPWVWVLVGASACGSSAAKSNALAPDAGVGPGASDGAALLDAGSSEDATPPGIGPGGSDADLATSASSPVDASPPTDAAPPSGFAAVAALGPHLRPGTCRDPTSVLSPWNRKM